MYTIAEGCRPTGWDGCRPGPSFPADISVKSAVARQRIIAGDKRYLVTIVGDLVDVSAET